MPAQHNPRPARPPVGAHTGVVPPARAHTTPNLVTPSTAAPHPDRPGRAAPRPQGLSLLARRGAALQATLGAVLLRDGHATAALGQLGHTTPGQWRAAAKAAGTIIERPVHTGLDPSGTVVWAVVTNWPRTAAELLRTGQLTHTPRGGRRPGPLVGGPGR